MRQHLGSRSTNNKLVQSEKRSPFLEVKRFQYNLLVAKRLKNLKMNKREIEIWTLKWGGREREKKREKE